MAGYHILRDIDEKYACGLMAIFGVAQIVSLIPDIEGGMGMKLIWPVRIKWMPIP